MASLEPRTLLSQAGFVNVTASPTVLWPPNGRMAPITVVVQGSDETGGESDGENGDNNTSGENNTGSENGGETGTLPANTRLVFEVQDSQGQRSTGPQTLASSRVTNQNGVLSFVLPLVASRAGYDFSGRHYVITVSAVNPTTNQTIGTGFTVVTVPHDMGHGRGGEGFHGGGSFYGGQTPQNRYESILLARQDARQQYLASHERPFANRPFRDFQNQNTLLLQQRQQLREARLQQLQLLEDSANTRIPPGHAFGHGHSVLTGQGNSESPFAGLTFVNDPGHGNGHGNANGHGHGRG